MNDDEIIELVTKLETSAHEHQQPIAKIIEKRYETPFFQDDQYGYIIVANRAGYINLAALFLNAAIAPFEDEEDSDSAKINVSLHHVMDEIPLGLAGAFERREDLAPKGAVDAEIKPSYSFFDACFSIGCALMLIGYFVLGIIGAAKVFDW